MPVNLNLLPQDLRISKELGVILKTIKSLNVILVVLFIVSILGAGTFFVISSIKLNSLQENVAKLEQQVKAQESSEQKLVLIKDRLSKISAARGYSNASANIENVSSILGISSSAAKIDSLNINPTKIDLSLTLLSNDDLKMYLQNFRDSGKFKLIDLYSFDYNKNIGYLVKVSLNSK